MSDKKFVVLVVGEAGCNIRQERMLKVLHEHYGERLEIVRQSVEDINGIEPDFMIMDELLPVVQHHQEYKHHRKIPREYWQRGRWGQ